MDDFGFQWHITDHCNLRCTHCYQDRFEPRGRENLDDLKSAADRIFSALTGRRVSVNLTGGEPLLVPSLFDLMEHLQGFSSLKEMSVITNGTLLTEPVLEQVDRFPRLTTLKVSLESAHEATNDAVRGAGSFRCVEESLARCLQTRKRVVLMMTLGRYNVGSIEETVAWARSAGAAGIVFERFVPMGRGSALSSQVLDAPEWGEALRIIARASGLDMDPLDLLAYRALWLSTEGDQEDRLSGALCNLGAGSMALMPDGSVFPCRRLPLAVGNILSEPFSEILGRLERWSMKEIRPRLTGPRCGPCGVTDCMGCRAVAYALTGDALADDPQCPLRGYPDTFRG